MQFAVFLITILGHVALWIGALNRLHSMAIPRRPMAAMSIVCLAMMGPVPIVAVCWWFAGGSRAFAALGPDARVPLLACPAVLWAIFIYAAICWAAGTTTFARWLCFQCFRRRPQLIRLHAKRRMPVNLAAAALSAEENVHHLSVHLPGNEALRLDLVEWSLDVPRLPAQLDGLTIAHISDLHFTGIVGKAFFREVVRACNELKPDLVAITGDLVDKSNCISWIPEILGRLTARYGVYAVLGNHDLRVDETQLRKAIAGGGLVDLGGRWLEIDIRGETVILAGNELPWFPPAADLGECHPRRDCPNFCGHRAGTDANALVGVVGKNGTVPLVARSPERGQLRIVLSHSPDQLAWARAYDADLMLSGHTHGGQIRIPPAGPIFSPSISGVKYDRGVFYEPPTILHVTCGISGKQPWRWNCPPEIALLTLRAAGASATSAASESRH